MNRQSKGQLRTNLRRRRQSLSGQAQASAMVAVAELAGALPQWSSATHIALYHACDGEVGTAALAQLGRDQGKQIYLPVIGAQQTMVFAQWREGDKLLPNPLGIPEPGENAARLPVSRLDIVFLPLVGWDQLGGRLGMGGGCYDRALTGVCGPLLVGLAHQIQELDAVPRDAWDIPLDAIITDSALYLCR